jgi:PAS domain S-box-containing protein
MSVTKSENSDEWFFSSDQYILSETDDRGLIIYANDLFCEIADYTLDELIGEPHNIVRHPDMPLKVSGMMCNQKVFGQEL